MQSDWSLRPLSDVADEITVGFVGTMADQYVDDGVPFLRSLNVRPLHIDTSDVKYISREFHGRLRKSELRPGDVVIVRTGKPGTCAVIPDEIREANCSDVVIVRCATGLRPAFLSYWVTAMAASHVSAHTVGAVQQHFNVGSAKLLRLPVPPLPIQDHVLAPLLAIDRRIDLLRQTNATLEAIAQTLFKSWFIDFDPVRAKAEGREPEGMDAATAALFPSEFEDSALGPIPKGWRASTLADAVDFNPRRSLPRGAQAPYLEMANAPTVGHRPIEPVGHRQLSSGCKFSNGDALLAKITPCLENGKSAFIDFLAADEVGWGSTEFIVMRAKPVLPEFGAYLLVRHAPLRQFAVQAMTGTSGRQRVELSQLSQFPLALPPTADTARALDPALRALQESIATNDRQAHVLTALRNTLLPRLISGQLCLPEAQAQIEEFTA